MDLNFRSIGYWLLVLGLITTAVFLAQQLIEYRRQSRYFNYLFSATILDPYGLNHFSEIPPPPSSGQLRVVVLGDSRAAHWPDPDWPAVEWVNRGVEAQSAVQVNGRFTAHVEPLKADVLIVQAGINDLRLIPKFPEQETQIIQTTVEQIEQIVQKATEAEMRVIVTTIFPTGDAHWIDQQNGNDALVKTAVLQVNEQLARLATDQVVVVDSFVWLADDQQQLKTPYAADYLHVTSTAYEILNEAIWPTVAAWQASDQEMTEQDEANDQ